MPEIREMRGESRPKTPRPRRSPGRNASSATTPTAGKGVPHDGRETPRFAHAGRVRSGGSRVPSRIRRGRRRSSCPRSCQGVPPRSSAVNHWRTSFEPSGGMAKGTRRRSNPESLRATRTAPSRPAPCPSLSPTTIMPRSAGHDSKSSARSSAPCIADARPMAHNPPAVSAAVSVKPSTSYTGPGLSRHPSGTVKPRFEPVMAFFPGRRHSGQLVQYLLDAP